MQTPKTRAATLEVPPRTQKAARQLKTSVAEVDKTPKVKSPKVVERRSPRTPISEKKRTGRVTELETQLASLQEELKKARDELFKSESLMKRAHEEAGVAKKQLCEMSEKLQDSQQRVDEISASEESRLQELRKISQDRDRAWESELEAVQKHHSMAESEVQNLKMQLENVVESEASQVKYAESVLDEVLKLRVELLETVKVVEELRIQLKDSRDSEARALDIAGQTREQLEIVKSTEETLKSEKVAAMKAYDSVTVELEHLKAKLGSLVKNNTPDDHHDDNDDDDGEEIDPVKKEVIKLKEELEGAEKRYQEAYTQSALQIRSAYELVEQTRTESCQKVSILEANLEKLKHESEDLKAKLVEKEEKLQNITEENKILNEKLDKVTEDQTYLKKLETILEDMKQVIFEKETELNNIKVENEKLQNQEALMKVSYLTEEVDKRDKKVERITEQLELVQSANAEMEAELRRLKVQTDQWRKAAEAAAAMLAGTNNGGKFVERTGSLDTRSIGGKLNSHLLEDMEDESPKKKNGNMLKIFGGFMKGKR